MKKLKIIDALFLAKFIGVFIPWPESTNSNSYATVISFLENVEFTCQLEKLTGDCVCNCLMKIDFR